MKAMILAAGLGTRLRPVTEKMPKALVMFEGKTLLEHAIDHLVKFGISSIIINVHHFSDQVTEFVKKLDYKGTELVISDESDELLETGGGLKKASWFFDDGKPFIVRNTDIISDLDLKEMISFHEKGKSVATLAVRDRQTSRYLLFDDENRLRGWQNIRTGEEKGAEISTGELRKLAFSGIHIIDPQIFDLMTESGKFSLTDLYLRLSGDHIIKGYVEKNRLWMDMGTINDLNRTTL